jgi:hypothetical protein
MSIDLPPSTERDLIQAIVTDIEDEIGPILAQHSTTIFPTMKKDRIIGKWIEAEISRMKMFCGYDNQDIADQYTDEDKRLFRDVIIFRVCARVLRTCQINRKVGKSFAQPTYLEMMKSFSEEARNYALYLREKYYPAVKPNDDNPYPPIPDEE